MARPLTVVYQEQATQTPQTVEPDLNTIVVGPAYQILDYVDDKAELEVSNYGSLNANNPNTPPVSGVPAIILAAPPDILPGAWVVPGSVGVFFDDFRARMAVGTDGSVTINDNLLTSAGATFIASGVAVGDTLVIQDPSAGPTDVVVTVVEVLTETTLRVSSNFTATTASLDYRVERTLQDTEIDATFVVPPTFRASNEITILGGVTVLVNAIARPVTYARVYVEYMAYRTDLQAVGSVTGTTQILANLGKIDARNPLAAHVAVAKANSGQASIYYYGIDTDDLAGYSLARDALSSNADIYAIVVCNPSTSIAAMFRTDNVTLADPVQALADGVPQRFRTVLSSGELPVTEEIIAEMTTATMEQRSGAIPPGVRTATFSGVNFLTSNVKPGDILILTASENVASLDGSYTISQINSATSVEVDTAFPLAVGVAEGVNLRVYRPSTNTDIIALVDGRATLTVTGVVYTSLVAGITPSARTIAKVQSGSTPNGIHSIVEVAGTSTIINGDFASGLITATMVVNALTTGAGVTTPFTGSINLLATTASGATVQAATAAAALSTGTPGIDSLTSTAVLDAVFIRVYDPNASFLTDGVIAGDILEIPANPNGVFTSTGTKRYVVNQVLSEQRLEIVNIATGVYVNNTSSVEAELPHFDNRLGTGTLVTQGSVRFQVIRDLSKDQQVANLAAVAQSIRSQRAVLAWPDECKPTGLVDGSLPRNSDGSAALADWQSGTYLAAALGGMTAGYPNHQGFSRMGIAGIDTIRHSTGYFTERQLTRLSDSGWYVFAQDNAQSLPYCIHQLTTDPSSLETGEYSMVKNFDYLSKFFVTIMDTFIGIWNVSEETVGFMRQAANSGIQQLKTKRTARIGAPINDASITGLFVSPASADRIELYIAVSRPTPLNTIGIHLVG